MSKLKTFKKHFNRLYFNKKRKIFYLIISFILIFILIFINLKKEEEINYGLTINEIIKKYGNKKYITINLGTSQDCCGGLGNMMWRTASLLGIGLTLNRTVYFDPIHLCYYQYKEKYIEIFNNSHKIFKFMNPNPKYIKNVIIAEPCCKFENSNFLKNNKERIIKIHGNYLQSYKYFNKYIKEIKEFYSFNENIKKGGELIAKKLFGNETKDFKFCVHIRRGDFIRIGQASKKRFTNKAINFLMPRLKKKFKQKNISIVLFGKDKNFLNELEIDEKYNNLYISEIKNSGVDMYFAINYCNAYLITASSSTYAWWIGFLMPKEVPVFYYDCHLECRHIKKNDYFLPKWKGIYYNYLGNLKFS